MGGTAFDAILKNLSDAAAIRASTLSGSSAFKTQNSTNKLNFYRELLNSQDYNPADQMHKIANLVLEQNTPTASPSFSSSGDKPQQQGSGFWSGVDKVTDEILPIKYAKDFGEKPGRELLKFLSRSGNASGALLNEWFPEKWSDYDTGTFTRGLSGAGKALMGQEQRDAQGNFLTPGTVIKKDPLLKESNGVVRGVTGFAADVAFDPLTYANPISWFQKGKALLSGGEKVATQVAEKAAPVAEKVATPTPSATEFVSNLGPAPEAVGKELVPFQKPRFAAGPGGVVSDARNPVQFADELFANNVSKAVQDAPVLAYPNLNIDPIYRSVENVVTERVPKKIYEEVEVPIEPKPLPEKKVETLSEKNARLSSPRAIKAILMQRDNAGYLIHGKPIGEWLSAAYRNPERKDEIDKIINREVMAISKDPKKLSKLPKSTYGEEDFPVLKLFPIEDGPSKLPSGYLRIDELTKLFKEGKVPSATAAEDFAMGFPLSDPQSLKAMFLKDAGGRDMSLHQYLTNLGVELKSVDEKGIEKSLNKIAPQDNGFKFDFEKKAEEAVPQFKKVKQARVVYENIEKKTVETKRLSKAEMLAWQVKYSQQLTPQEVKYLRAANSPALFDKRVAELRLKTIAGTHKTLKEFVDAAKAGVISKQYVDDLLEKVGAKSVDDLYKRATAIISKTGPAKKAPAVAEATPTLDDFAVDSSKVERYVGRPDDTIFDIPSPVQLIEEAKTNPGVLVKDTPELTPEMLENISKALPKAIVDNLIDPQDVSKYPFVTNLKKAKRTDAKPFVGKARNLQGWNKYSQLDTWKVVVDSAKNRFNVAAKAFTVPKEASKFKSTRPSVMYDEVMGSMLNAELAMKQAGVKFIAGDQKDGLLLSMMDVLSSVDRKVIEKHLFEFKAKKVNGKWSVSWAPMEPTLWLDAAENMVRASLTGGNMKLAEEYAMRMFGAPRPLHAQELAKALKDAMPSIMTKVNQNYAEYGIEVGTSVVSMSRKVIDDVISKYADPNVSESNAFATLLNRKKATASVAASIKAPSDAKPIADVLVDTELAKAGIAPGDLAEAKTTNAIVNAPDSKATAKAGVAQQKSREAEAMTLLENMGETVEDLSDYIRTTQQAGIFRANHPLLDKASSLKELIGRGFIHGYGYGDIHNALKVTQNYSLSAVFTHRSIMERTANIASEIAGPDARALTSQAFRMLQQGAEINDPRVAQIAESMKNSIDILFSDVDKGVASITVRNGIFTEHVNNLMDYFGVEKSIRFDSSLPLKEQADAWRSWSVEDPLDQLDRIHCAYQGALVDATVGRNFSTQFGKTSAAPGYVKFHTDNANSVLGKYVDKDLYYPREIIAQIPYYDNIRNATYSSSASSNAKQFLKLFDSAQHAVKTGWTILRPGHHLSNLMGDVLLNYFGGVNNAAVYWKSRRILAGRSSMYSTWDGVQAIREGKGLPASVAKGKGIKVGKKFSMTDDEVWRAAYTQGLMPNFTSVNDTLFNDAQQFSSIYKGNKIKNAGKAIVEKAGSLANAEAHFTRMAHFVNALENSKAATLDDAIKEAGAIVRKWHPDGTDLTPMERKVMRRIMPFYAWLRGSTPLILQTIAMQPGKAMVIPKALNSLATTMGIDPESLANPFPPGTVLPEWMMDSVVGPQWTDPSNNHKMGMTLPGDPVTQTINNQINNPVGTLLNAVTPFAKVPVELATGRSLATGAPINDKSDYADQNIPLVSVLANITNRSVTGLGEPQQDVVKGNQAPGMDETALVNFLTGLGIRDYSKPNYIKGGILELRDKYRKQALGG